MVSLFENMKSHLFLRSFVTARINQVFYEGLFLFLRGYQKCHRFAFVSNHGLIILYQLSARQ